MHRKFGVVVAVAIGVTAVLATAGLAMRSAGSTTQAFPTEPVNLTMWWWGEQEAAGAKKWLAQTVAAYQKKHPNVKIKTVLQTTDGLIPAFKAAAAAKKGPDIQYFWGGIWSLDDAWLGNTKPVSDYIPQVRAGALPEREGGHLRRQGLDGTVVRAAVVPRPLPQGRAREGRRRRADDAGPRCSRRATS